MKIRSELGSPPWSCIHTGEHACDVSSLAASVEGVSDGCRKADTLGEGFIPLVLAHVLDLPSTYGKVNPFSRFRMLFASLTNAALSIPTTRRSVSASTTCLSLIILCTSRTTRFRAESTPLAKGIAVLLSPDLRGAASVSLHNAYFEFLLPSFLISLAAGARTTI
jgi:hypothetical protein